MSQVLSASNSTNWHKVVVLPLSAPKGYPVLIEAVGLLRERGRNVRLTLVGDGPLRTVLEGQIVLRGLGDLIHLAGACNHDHVVDFYASNDAFVLSSFLEGIPVVLMEAMAMELPCVATWIAGIPEIIEHDVEGLLVPPATASTIADAVERLMEDPEGARRLGIAARRKVVAKYHLGRNVERLAQEFRARLAT